MRRLISLRSSHALMLSIAALLVVQGGLFGAPVAGQEATPPGGDRPSMTMEIEEFEGVFVADLGMVLYPDPADPGNLDLGTTLRLKRVRLEPGHEQQIEGHEHTGAFVLTVAEGAICYEQDNDISSGPKVTAMASTGATDPGCAATRTDCADADGCDLQQGDVVYLPTGSSVIQEDTAWHLYNNVDPVNRAIVYLAEYQPGQNAAPCGGGCG